MARKGVLKQLLSTQDRRGPMDQEIRFRSGMLELEGRVERRPGHKGVVITHPHPQYGGDMYNPVVEALCRVYAGHGFSTLRFNFRGVGSSSGTYANGSGERQDLDSAVIRLMETGVTEVDRSGYSFGSWVGTFPETRKLPPGKALMVSPPVGFMDFSPAERMSSLFGVVSGEFDEIAPVGEVRKLVDRLNPAATFRMVPGADHFYSGCLDLLEDTLNGVLAERD